MTLNHYPTRSYFHSPLELCRLQDRLSDVHRMQSAKIAHYTHFLQSCSTHKSTNNSTNSNTVEQNERLFPDRHIMCSHLTILPRQQSFELSGYLRYSVKSIPLELSFSNSLSHNTKLTIPELHVCNCTDDYKLYHPLERYSSTFIIFHSRNLMATCCLNLWLTCQLLTDSIGITHYQNDTTLDHSYVWAYMHLQHMHFLTILVEVNRVNWISLGLTYRE